MKKSVKLLLLLIWMGLIFFFSAQPDVESEETSNLVAEIIYRIYAFVMNGNASLSQSEFMIRFVPPIRKFAHFTEFMILAILIFINVVEYRKKNVALISFVLAVLYAMSDEFHQLFVPNRYGSIRDVLIDSAGCLLGIFICHLFYERWKKVQ